MVKLPSESAVFAAVHHFLPHHCQTTWMRLDTKLQTHVELWTKLMLRAV